MFTKHKAYLNKLTDRFVDKLPNVMTVEDANGVYQYHDVYCSLKDGACGWSVYTTYEDDNDRGTLHVAFTDQDHIITRTIRMNAEFDRVLLELVVYDMLSNYLALLDKLAEIAEVQPELDLGE